ncbi:hypothetical protein RhiLY_10228 [Ceratobasidium sp. AG-Ba]|nr:hypothetical protein RhiLY_10228 [Ceratobasidium sp. AG-Ba]
MSMSNSNLPFGGYLDSSDHEGDNVNTVQQQGPYVPPRVTVASKPGLGSFQLPSSVASRTSVPPAGKPNAATTRYSSVPLSKSAHVHGVSRRLTPGGSSAAQSRQSTPNLATGAVSRDNTAESPNPSAPRMPSTQPSILLERQVNQLSGSFEEYKSTAEQRHTSLDSTLTRILTRIEQLEAGASSSTLPASQTLSAAPLAAPASRKGLNPELFPPATPELIDIVERVNAEARFRVGNRRSGADENLAKEQVRQTFYRLINIRASREVKPYFEDEFGEPDTLPAQFIDPVTGECPVFPHWKAPLTKQTEWIPAFLRRYRLSIPNNGSPSSEMLRNKTDKEIITLLMDGTFKTCATTWGNFEKTEEEIAQMQAQARAYQRAERKANMRRPYIALIPDLQSPRFEYLSHAGYMSPDESDNEGGLCTKRPDYRAQWTNNLYAAIDVAEQKKPGFRPGFRSRHMEIVRRPIPRLERGRGSSKVLIRIAHCGISKTWRKTYPDDFTKYAPLIDTRDTTKPDITSFLEQHPEPHPDEKGTAIKPESGQSSGALEIELHEEDGQRRDFGLWDGLDYPGDKESGAVLDMNGSFYGAKATAQGVTLLASGSGAGNSDTIEIDPEVLEDEARLQAAHTAIDRDMPLNLPNPNNAFTTSHVSGMPPPPPLNSAPNSNANQAALQGIGRGSSKDKGKKRAPPEAGGEAGELVEEDEKEAPVRKRRGRPPGSKNKPKTSVQMA